ncbi:hypothetical protein GCM10022239_12250 [Leifsonia bigeumensis]|uniref:DUF202 domain-containing protein n=1 Tax=Leifsonella bigeumensis TaxID=433643 RepID=A0ABP7FFK0_9MICO
MGTRLIQTVIELPDRPFDLGLQAERTALSWQRTTLALAVGILIAARLLAEISIVLSSTVAGVGLIATSLLFFVGYRRYRSAHRALVAAAEERVAFSKAFPLFVWALAVFCLAIAGLGFVLTVTLGR